MAIITRALYGLTTSAEGIRSLLADFFCPLGFNSSQYNRDFLIRIRDEKDSHDYICTHVYDFNIIAYYAESWLQKISHNVLVKSHSPRSCYLGNGYTYYEDIGMWMYGGNIYTKDDVCNVERICGCLPKISTPLLVKDCHPELDKYSFLGLKLV